MRADKLIEFSQFLLNEQTRLADCNSNLSGAIFGDFVAAVVDFRVEHLIELIALSLDRAAQHARLILERLTIAH